MTKSVYSQSYFRLIENTPFYLQYLRPAIRINTTFILGDKNTNKIILHNIKGSLTNTSIH